MESRRIIVALVVVALILATSLAFFKNKKILGAQYHRSATLTLEGDQLFLNKSYKQASEKYQQALIADPKDSRLWTKLLESERKATILQVQASMPKTLTQSVPTPKSPESKVVPQVTQPQPQGAIIEEDEGC